MASGTFLATLWINLKEYLNSSNILLDLSIGLLKKSPKPYFTVKHNKSRVAIWLVEETIGLLFELGRTKYWKTLENIGNIQNYCKNLQKSRKSNTLIENPILCLKIQYFDFENPMHAPQGIVMTGADREIMIMPSGSILKNFYDFSNKV